MTLQTLNVFTAANQQRTATNVRGNVQIRLGLATVNDTTGAYAATQAGTFSIYTRGGSRGPAGQETDWQIKQTGIAAPIVLEYFFTDFVDLRVVATAISVGAALPCKVVDGEATAT